MEQCIQLNHQNLRLQLLNDPIMCMSCKYVQPINLHHRIYTPIMAERYWTILKNILHTFQRYTTAPEPFSPTCSGWKENTCKRCQQHPIFLNFPRIVHSLAKPSSRSSQNTTVLLIPFYADAPLKPPLILPAPHPHFLRIPTLGRMPRPVAVRAPTPSRKLPLTMSSVALFVSPVLVPFQAHRTGLKSPVRRIVYHRRPCQGARMATGDSGDTEDAPQHPQDGPSEQQSNSDNEGAPANHPARQPFNRDHENLITMGRFREFISPDAGDERTRDDIAQQALRQATYMSTSESIDSTIQANLNLLSDLLSDLYARSEREIIERNEKMTLRSTLPIMSKMNQKVMAGQESLRLQKMAISKEMQLVQALLKQSSRKKRSSTRSSSNRRRRNRIGDGSDSSTSVLSGLANPSGFLFTAVVCIVSIETFENFMAGEGGTDKLTNISTWSALAILSLAYINAVRSALRKTKADLERKSLFHRRDRDRQS